MWDAYIVFNFLKWSPAANLSLPQLTLRVVLLCLLLSGQRGQALWLLDLCNITWSKTDIRCTFESISSRFPLQTDIRTNLCLEAFLKINLCVWCTTCVTIRKNLCFEGFRDKTFYKLESPSLRCLEGHTTTKWTKMSLKTAGIDMSRFTAHSTWSSSTSKAIQKLPLATILKAVGWRSLSTFATLYKKPICEGNAFQNAVLSHN